MEAHIEAPAISGLSIHEIRSNDDYPAWIGPEDLARCLNRIMKPYEDTPEDIREALRYMSSSAEGKGGFLLLVEREREPLGAVVMLATGMSGYIPEHVLVFVGVVAEMRGKGIGEWLIREALQRCPGEVKLHVEYDNPAKRLYERIGFTSKYAEMRIAGGGGQA
jgi:ribosomal-protein-alanine N-acetyltransferase